MQIFDDMRSQDDRTDDFAPTARMMLFAPTGAMLRKLRFLMIGDIPSITLWRRELFFAMCQSLREFLLGNHPTLEAAAVAVRNRTRRAGRYLGLRAVGRTLLVKGLEFDHCLVLDADSLKVKDLYVAFTRATRTLTVLSKSQLIQPKE